MARHLEIEDPITVGSLAERLSLPATRLIGELFKNGVMATVNERIDFDTAQIIVTELKLDVELTKKAVEITGVSTRRDRKTSQADNAQTRPPVVAVMGHVDHGKTSLLDALLKTSVAKGEAGGITQHISAYQVRHGDKAITFLDTPGHEAFAAIREHGAQLTDLVVLVVAADDGVKPQTIEAIRFAKKAGVKIIVAINKMDKEGADPNRVKSQLTEHDVLVTDFRGDTEVAEVSAKTGQGIDALQDLILLVAEVDDLKAVTEGPASGLIIEAHVETGRGPVAHALVEEGTLKKGDFVVAGGTYARVRNLDSTIGHPLTTAAPSTPVVISGFKQAPEFGDQFQVVKNEKEARSLAEKNAAARRVSGRLDMNSSELMRMINRSNKLQEFNIIVRGDVQGSLTSVLDSLRALDTDEVAVRVVASGVGAITENDMALANTTGATVYGFNVPLPPNIRRLASRDKVDVKLYNIIYELIDDAREQLSQRLAPEVQETVHGTLQVKAVFKTTKTDLICGGEVQSGKIVSSGLARVRRGDEVLAEAEVTNLKRGPQDTKEVFEGELCGLSLKTANRVELLEGDLIDVYTVATVERHL